MFFVDVVVCFFEAGDVIFVVSDRLMLVRGWMEGWRVGTSSKERTEG
jgi:hypothetical protein